MQIETAQFIFHIIKFTDQVDEKGQPVPRIGYDRSIFLGVKALEKLILSNIKVTLKQTKGKEPQILPIQEVKDITLVQSEDWSGVKDIHKSNMTKPMISALKSLWGEVATIPANISEDSIEELISIIS